MSSFKEQSNELRRQIEDFFTLKKTELEVTDFVSKMRIKSSKLIPSTMNLMPFTADDCRLLKVHANQLGEFLSLIELLEEKQTYLRKESN